MTAPDAQARGVGASDSTLLTQALQANASRLGLTWQRQMATVVDGTNAAAVRATLDGDTAVVTMVSMIGPLPAGQRVYVDVLPPSGMFICGFAGTPVCCVGGPVVSYTPAISGAVGGITIGSGSTRGRYRRSSDGTVTVDAEIIFAGDSSWGVGAGDRMVSLPNGILPSASELSNLPVQVTGYNSATGNCYPFFAVVNAYAPDQFIIFALQQAFPFTWGANSQLLLHAEFDAA